MELRSEDVSNWNVGKGSGDVGERIWLYGCWSIGFAKKQMGVS